MLNLYSQASLHDGVFHACVMAVRDGFPHLTAQAIIDPPHEWFDAALARQVVIHLMVRVFLIPKRRVVEQQERSREAVNRALRTIDQRLNTPRFETHYCRIAAAARASLTARMEDAA
ncbi:hypothetical protein [Rhizobium paknamense]|uniref:Uncharacterized protein n=1 Tax=Rhizobium paknamense TaxID=1206817 RepID=A0ABU0I8Q6_9HYPH|nr:hypothetical protein [Rhizobium paknamense]MDQ0454622.1 hypothetical protein [Rhizobium paknamense]